MALQIKSQERKVGVFDVALIGRLDSSTYLQLENIFNMLISGGTAKAIVLDLALLEYISSMGLRVIFKAMKDLKDRSGMLMISNMQPQVKKIFEIANAVDQDSIFSSVEEADRYYTSIQEKVKNQNM